MATKVMLQDPSTCLTSTQHRNWTPSTLIMFSVNFKLMFASFHLSAWFLFVWRVKVRGLLARWQVNVGAKLVQLRLYFWWISFFMFLYWLVDKPAGLTAARESLMKSFDLETALLLHTDAMLMSHFMYCQDATMDWFIARQLFRKLLSPPSTKILFLSF